MQIGLDYHTVVTLEDNQRAAHEAIRLGGDAVGYRGPLLLPESAFGLPRWTGAGATPNTTQARTNHQNRSPFFNYRFGDETPGCCDGGCDDRVTLSTQYSTQWDSLALIGYEFDLTGTGEAQLCFYNGYVADRDIIPPAKRDDAYVMPLGIEAFAEAAVQTRGVLLDVEHHFGRGPIDLRFEHIMRVLDADRIVVKPGDILCLHTGFTDEVLKMNKNPDAERVRNICAAVDGRDQDLLQWLSDRKIAGLTSDNYAVERVGLPRTAAQPTFVPLHHHCLFKRGIPLGELWYLTELASWLRERKRNYFLLTAPPLRLPGAVGSPVTPVATV